MMGWIPLRTNGSSRLNTSGHLIASEPFATRQTTSPTLGWSPAFAVESPPRNRTRLCALACGSTYCAPGEGDQASILASPEATKSAAGRLGPSG